MISTAFRPPLPSLDLQNALGRVQAADGVWSTGYPHPVSNAHQ